MIKDTRIKPLGFPSCTFVPFVVNLSIPCSFKTFQRSQCDHVLRIHLVSALVVILGFVPVALVLIDTSQIEMREVVRFVTLCADGVLQPWNGLIPLAQLNQVSTDIVIRISKLRVYLDSFQTIGDGVVEAFFKAVSPAAKSVSLRRG